MGETCSGTTSPRPPPRPADLAAHQPKPPSRPWPEETRPPPRHGPRPKKITAAVDPSSPDGRRRGGRPGAHSERHRCPRHPPLTDSGPLQEPPPCSTRGAGRHVLQRADPSATRAPYPRTRALRLAWKAPSPHGAPPSSSQPPLDAPIPVGSHPIVRQDQAGLPILLLDAPLAAV